MPRPSDFHSRQFKHTIFVRIQEAIEEARKAGENPISLHVGDTWYDLPKELETPLDSEPWNTRLSRYGNTQGDSELRKRLLQKVQRVNHLPASSPSEIQITFGATGALFLAMQRLLDDGDEVLSLSPQWTIFRVVANEAGAHMVEVPFFDKLSDNPTGDILEWIEPCVTEKTRAIYFNSPNNPTGVMLNPGQIQALAEFAKQHDLWVLSDEAYEDFVWTDIDYLSIGSLPNMFERTISVFSFSKSYAAAGLRLGYIVAPNGVIAALNPTHVGVGYEPNRPSQVQGIRGLEHTQYITLSLQVAYREGLQAAVDNMSVPYLRPDGSFYLFLDLRDRWTGLTDEEKLQRMISAGVILSPGEHFGRDYDGWARFCYTSEPPAIIAEAARRASNL